MHGLLVVDNATGNRFVLRYSFMFSFTIDFRNLAAKDNTSLLQKLPWLGQKCGFFVWQQIKVWPRSYGLSIQISVNVASRDSEFEARLSE